MKPFCFVGLVWALLAGSANATYFENYSYPEKNAYRATLAAATLRSDRQDVRNYKPVVQRRSWDMYLKRRAFDQSQLKADYRFPVTMYLHRKRAPLMILLPGLNSSPNTPLSAYVAETVFKMGYHVVVVPSNFHWTFAYSASRSGVVGDIKRDAKDMYRALRVVKTWVVKHYGTPITSVNLMGYSAGGYMAAALAVEDERQRRLNFGKIVSLNPMYNIDHSIRFLQRIQQRYGGPSSGLKLRALGEIRGYAKNNNIHSRDYIRNFYRQLSLNTRESKQAIVYSFSDGVDTLSRNVSYVYRKEQQRRGQRATRLPAKVSDWSAYVNHVLRPYSIRHLGYSSRSFRNKVRNENIMSYIRQLKDRSNFYMFHNVDDFLITRDQAFRLNNMLGRNMYLYPYGGHFGNFWHPVNKSHLREVLVGGQARQPMK